MPIANGDPRPSRAEQRWFGLLLLAAFSILGVVLGWQLGSPRLTHVMAGVGLFLALLYYTVTPLRVPLYLAWMALTMPLGRLISTVILALIYFLSSLSEIPAPPGGMSYTGVHAVVYGVLGIFVLRAAPSRILHPDKRSVRRDPSTPPSPPANRPRRRFGWQLCPTRR